MMGTSKLNILAINNYAYLRGGSERYFLELNKLLRESGHRVLAMSTRKGNETETNKILYIDGVNLDHPRPWNIGKFLYSREAEIAVGRAIERFKPDVAHLHIYYGQFTASILRPLKKARIPIVQTLHEYKLVCPVYTLYRNGAPCEDCQGRRFWKAAHRRCNRGSIARSLVSVIESYMSRILGNVEKVDHFIGVSEFLRHKMIQHGLLADKITTVHNFTDCERKPPAREVGRHFLYFGRIERLKGVFTLIDAAEHVKEFPLLIVGTGNDQYELADEIERRNLSHIHLLGFKTGESLEELIRTSICVIAPSEWYEPFGLTVIESFALGRPVIASRIGGLTELIDEGVNGFLFTPGNMRELVERMRWFANNRGLAIEMGSAGHSNVQDRFSGANHVEQVVNVYRKVIN